MNNKVVENKVQTVRNILTDLNRILRNTEVFHQNFIRYGIANHPPHNGSHLVWNTDIERYQFWLPSKEELKNLQLINLDNFEYKYRGTIKQLNYVYYPNGLPYIALVDDVSWMVSLYNEFCFKKEHVQALSAMYGTQLHNYIISSTTLEREEMKRVLIDSEHKNLHSKSKNLF